MSNTSLKPPTRIQGRVNHFQWYWEGESYEIVYETIGKGSLVLLLPAMSTVSSRSEMAGIAQVLSTHFEVFALDWLGFGDSSRPSLDYQPAIYHELLRDFVTSTFDTPVVIVAAGHSSGYALQLYQNNPQLISKIVLIAPTWLGPLCAMGLPEAVRSSVRKMIQLPVLGELLYGMNTTPSFLRWMYSRHVYIDREKLTSQFIADKQKITQHPQARYAPGAFVTGRLDPVTTREEFLDYFGEKMPPVLVILAENAPPKSKGEMEAIAGIKGVEIVRSPGTLGLHEEHARQVGEAIWGFLQSC